MSLRFFLAPLLALTVLSYSTLFAFAEERYEDLQIIGDPHEKSVDMSAFNVSEAWEDIKNLPYGYIGAAGVSGVFGYHYYRHRNMRIAAFLTVGTLTRNFFVSLPIIAGAVSGGTCDMNGQCT
jgi:hypothetical protein